MGSDKLKAAFAELRQRGFLARQNYYCCGGCGMYAMNERVKEMAIKNKKVRGVVFYHNQDNARRKEGKDFHLNFAGVGVPTESVGHEIVATLNRNGIVTEWDGSATTRIRILVSSI